MLKSSDYECLRFMTDLVENLEAEVNILLSSDLRVREDIEIKQLFVQSLEAQVEQVQTKIRLLADKMTHKLKEYR